MHISKPELLALGTAIEVLKKTDYSNLCPHLDAIWQKGNKTAVASEKRKKTQAVLRNLHK